MERTTPVRFSSISSSQQRADRLLSTGTYGITTNADALTLKFVTHGPFSTNIGSRVYLVSCLPLRSIRPSF